MNIRELLIEDIKKLSDKEVTKLYKYVRRHLIADIEGLEDPLEKSQKEYVESPKCQSVNVENLGDDSFGCLNCGDHFS